jgi:hypothetical protein
VHKRAQINKHGINNNFYRAIELFSGGVSRSHSPTAGQQQGHKFADNGLVLVALYTILSPAHSLSAFI